MISLACLAACYRDERTWGAARAAAFRATLQLTIDVLLRRSCA